MIVLDTNVLSELMRPKPHPAVFGWVAAQPRATLFTTSIHKAEILYGIAALPEGRRRHALPRQRNFCAEEFAGRVLGVPPEAARYYAAIVTDRRRAGNPIEAFDALIAAAARAAGARVATRDIGGFKDCGVNIIDPWHAV